MSPLSFLYLRFLVLVALQTAHLPRVNLGGVDVFVDHEFILADAGRGKPRLGSRLGGGRLQGQP